MIVCVIILLPLNLGGQCPPHSISSLWSYLLFGLSSLGTPSVSGRDCLRVTDSCFALVTKVGSLAACGSRGVLYMICRGPLCLALPSSFAYGAITALSGLS